MALSGSVSTGSYDGRYYTVSWTASQDITNNKSTISWTLSCAGGNSSWYAERTLKVVVAGSTVVNKTDRVVRYVGTISSGTVTVSHSTSGTASFSISIQAAVYTSAVNCSGSNTFTLNTIPRASSISCGTFTMGSAGTISVSRASSSFTHTIKYTFGSYSDTICTKSSSTSVSWTPPLKLAYAVPNATSGIGTLTIVTYSGSTQIGSKSISFTCNVPSSVEPSCSASVSNTDTTFSCYAKLLSGVKVTPTASGSYGSSITKITISVTDKDSKSASSETAYTFDAFTSTGTKTISVSVTDSRGRTASWSTTVTVSDYSLPTSGISASRGTGTTTSDFVASDVGDKAKVTATGSVSSISGNTISVSLQYRVTGSSAWTSLTATASGLSLNTTQIISADDVSSYDIRVIITDKAGKTSTSMMTLSNAFATVDYKSGGDGVAFGKTASNAGFDCAMVMRILNGGYFRNESAGNGGDAYWHYNNSGTQTQVGRIYATSDGFYLNASSGHLTGTWSGTLSDARMKRDIEPVAQNIIEAVGEVPFVQFRMSAEGYDHDKLYVGILAQDLRDAFERHNVSDQMLMLDKMKLYTDGDDEYFCIEYTHFLIVRVLYDEMKISSLEARLSKIESTLKL